MDNDRVGAILERELNKLRLVMRPLLLCTGNCGKAAHLII